MPGNSTSFFCWLNNILKFEMSSAYIARIPENMKKFYPLIDVFALWKNFRKDDYRLEFYEKKSPDPKRNWEDCTLSFAISDKIGSMEYNRIALNIMLLVKRCSASLQSFAV